MDNPNLYRRNKQHADLNSKGKIDSSAREKKLEKALLEVFPVNLYRQIKELPETYNEDHKVIDHFVNHGIEEMNFKQIIKENINYLDLDIPPNQLSLIHI